MPASDNKENTDIKNYNYDFLTLNSLDSRELEKIRTVLTNKIAKRSSRLVNSLLPVGLAALALFSVVLICFPFTMFFTLIPASILIIGLFVILSMRADSQETIEHYKEKIAEIDDIIGRRQAENKKNYGTIYKLLSEYTEDLKNRDDEKYKLLSEFLKTNSLPDQSLLAKAEVSNNLDTHARKHRHIHHLLHSRHHSLPQPGTNDEAAYHQRRFSRSS